MRIKKNGKKRRKKKENTSQRRRSPDEQKEAATRIGTHHREIRPRHYPEKNDRYWETLGTSEEAGRKMKKRDKDLKQPKKKADS